MRALVDVSICVKDGRLAIVPGGRGPAYCYVCGDVAPNIFDDDDFQITAVYMESDCGTARDYLSGEWAEQAEQILVNDDEWRQWALRQVRRAAA